VTFQRVRSCPGACRHTHTLAEPRGSLETANARHFSSARLRSALTVTQRRLPRRVLRFALLRVQERSLRLLHAPELGLPQQSVRWSPIPLPHPPTRTEFLRLPSAAPHSQVTPRREEGSSLVADAAERRKRASVRVLRP
jgi:hypothetical protein